MYTNTCKQCGQPFKAKASRARYCGSACFKASQANNHIKGLIDQLERASYAPHEDAEKWRRYWRRVFAEPGVIDINRLDATDPANAQSPFDEDVREAKDNQLHIETDTSRGRRSWNAE